MAGSFVEDGSLPRLCCLSRNNDDRHVTTCINYRDSPPELPASVPLPGAKMPQELKVRLEDEPDLINHPPHYSKGGIEAIDVIEAWELGFCLGNTVKYIARHEDKGTPLEDLKKARFYLDYEIAKRERIANINPDF